MSATANSICSNQVNLQQTGLVWSDYMTLECCGSDWTIATVPFLVPPGCQINQGWSERLKSRCPHASVWSDPLLDWSQVKHFPKISSKLLWLSSTKEFVQRGQLAAVCDKWCLAVCNTTVLSEWKNIVTSQKQSKHWTNAIVVHIGSGAVMITC